ncbi:MAG TPA: pyridoxal-phosphate dependent enzyme [Acidobacteriota bacterium]|nr:pyridoxal-phosphate dependent enzyme [Acidobacteriota bacterium]
MIDLTVQKDRLEHAVRRVQDRKIIIPTLAQMRNPGLIPDPVKEALTKTGLWDLSPHNLFRITWKNERATRGGGFGNVNFIEFPRSLTGVEARIVALIGKWFPTGAHKVGAAFGCLVPRLVTGQFDPSTQKAVWPSTGNFCRGGAYDSGLLGCRSVAILPSGMSRERFEWLSSIAGEVIRTPGSESNVKEIFDKCWELRKSGEDLMIFNQFEEAGNYLWHYAITGSAMEEVLMHELGSRDAYRGVVLTTGSAGTIACGDYLKRRFPASKIAAAEALQCPTLLENGFGAHRIEGIGDKHVPWIHNVKNTDLVMGIDDAAVVRLARLFNEPVGRSYLSRIGVPVHLVTQLDLLGFSGIANLIASIKFAKYYELGNHDLVLTVLTDSMELYRSRLEEMQEKGGEYSETDATSDFSRYLLGISTDHLQELTYAGRRRVHNLKYFTWIEQQGRSVEELHSQWNDPDYWTNIQRQEAEIDSLIEEFNARTAGSDSSRLK